MSKPSALSNFVGKFLRSEESLSIGAGLAFLCTLIVTLAASSLLLISGGEASATRSRQHETQLLGSVLARSAEQMLTSSDLSSVRRMLIELRQNKEVSKARITLPTGETIADAEPSHIDLPTLPERWAMGPLDAQDEAPADGSTCRFPIAIAGRGSATLELQMDGSTNSTGRAEYLTCVALIGAAGLLANLLIYRRIRQRLVALNFIRDALLSVKGGQTANRSLSVDPRLGKEAAAWNDLISQCNRAGADATLERARVVLGDRRDSKLDLESAVDGLSVGIVVLDSAGRVRHANGAAATLLQQNRTQFIGVEILKVIGDNTVSQAIAAVLGGASNRRVAELILPGAAGESVLKVNVRPLRREDAGGVLVTIEDVTQQKSADAARNGFVVQATHELRTPLTNMRLCIEEAMERENLTSSELASHLNMLGEESRRLERIVGDMLTFSQIEAGSMQMRQHEVKLDRLLQDLAADFESQARSKQITIEWDLPPKYPAFTADRDKLMLAIHNLIGNAIKYTPNSGVVKVSVESSPTSLSIVVKDSGIGISVEDQKKLFTRFFRASDPRVGKIVGSGLGLSLAREVARMHGGDISVESAIDQGSTFRLQLPIAAHSLAA